MNTILRYDVLKQADSGEPFDLVFITADERRQTGGEIKEVTGWKKVKSEPTDTRLPGQHHQKSVDGRNPHHSSHHTINIFNPSNPKDHIVTVHWRLMVFFNNQRIVA